MAEFILRRIQILLGANRVEEILELRPRRNTSHEQLTVGQAHLAAAGGVKQERKASSSYRHRREKAPPTDSDTTHARARPPDSDNGRRRRQQTNKQTNQRNPSLS